ncbi:WD40 repeat domain-containing protein [Sorangium sp. So ce233]|uniref:WD40 repeat domain-containing protein n=1 Tax=Sorangium sp. So ce233 TaxID=3133290 RepID=UPI003F5FCD77
MAHDPGAAVIDPRDGPALERCARDGELAALLAAWAAAPADATADDAARRLIVAALRIDLPLLVDDPSLLRACLYNRVRWLEPLRAWAERWRGEWRAGAPWARALRPPEHAPGGALREEYRAALGAGRLRLSLDGRTLAVGGDGGALAWDRATGRRLADDAAARLVPGPGRFEIDRWRRRGEHWGRVQVRDRHTGEEIEVAVDDDSSFGEICDLPGETGYIAAGWCGDYEGVVCRVDRPARRARWRTQLAQQVHAIAVDRSGRLVAVAGGRDVHVLDAASGEVLAASPLDAQTLALGDDGATLATRHGDLVRVWDVAALRRGPVARLTGAEEGWVDAAFSPDGARLLTGELLWDARTGQLVARLSLDGPGYLEGGPPQDGRRLGSTRFVEMAPSGVRVYATDGGRLLLCDQARRYGLRDDVEISPDCEHYVHGRGGFGHEGPIEYTLLRVDDGAARASLGPADRARTRFAPDGLRLITGAGARMTAWRVRDGAREAVFEHPAPVTGVAVAHDGRTALTTAGDGVLRLWDADRGTLLGSRQDDGRAPTSGRWAIAPETLARATGWLGFTATPHPHVVRRRGGLAEIAAGDRVHVRVVTDQALIGDPSGTRWASRWDLVAIER